MKINCKIVECAFHNRVKDTCTLSEITIKPIDIDGIGKGTKKRTVMVVLLIKVIGIDHIA